MSNELVPVSVLSPELRAMFARADIANIGEAAEERIALDAYAEQQIGDVILENNRKIAENPLLVRLGKIEEVIGHERPEQTVSLQDVVRSKTEPTRPSHTMATDATIKSLFLTMHPDRGGTQQQIDALKDITASRRAVDSTPSTHITIAASIAKTAEADDAPETLELRRYQAFVGLAAGGRTKYANREDVDEAVVEERKAAEVASPFVVLNRAYGITLKLLGYNTELGEITNPQLFGERAAVAISRLNKFAKYLERKKPEDFRGVGTNPVLRLRFSSLVGGLELAGALHEVKMTTHQTQAQREVWQELLLGITGDFSAITDRLKILEVQRPIDESTIALNAIQTIIRMKQKKEYNDNLPKRNY